MQPDITQLLRLFLHLTIINQFKNYDMYSFSGVSSTIIRVQFVTAKCALFIEVCFNEHEIFLSEFRRQEGLEDIMRNRVVGCYVSCPEGSWDRRITDPRRRQAGVDRSSGWMIKAGWQLLQLRQWLRQVIDWCASGEHPYTWWTVSMLRLSHCGFADQRLSS